jgi:peptidyl-prolyl cis-trans isomerase A (cyclophilin A)
MNASLPKLVFCALLLAPALASQAQTPAAPHKPATTAHKASTASSVSLLKPATLTAKAPAEFKASFTTTAGVIVIAVHRDWAPLGADRFYNLVRRGFFSDASFFRVVPGFVVQFGLNADPAINHAWEEAKISDDPVKQSNKRGTLVFATAGPNTRTTQLFINFGDNSRLDGMGFAPFGEVTQGMDIVDKIYSGYGEQPQQDQITNVGDAYISQNFPKIDKIKLARIVPPVPAHPATPAKPATPKSPKPPAAK